MIDWRERPAEVAHLLNPAFIAALIARTAGGYQDEATAAIPFPLLFIAMPIVLHRKTREQLPRDTRTRMTTWLQRTPEARVGFATRAREVAPFIREGLSLGLSARALRVTPDGGVEPGPGISLQRLLVQRDNGTKDVNECLRRARFAGTWLARAGSPSTVFALWGVRP